MLITLLLHVTLALPAGGALSAAAASAAIAEAAGVWAPYGVAIDADTAECAVDDPSVLTVVPVRTAVSAVTPSWRGPLGSIAFDRDGAPLPAITVFLTDIERFIAGAHPLTTGWRPLPALLRDLLLGRVLGRVLAHEVGHFLLRSRQHARGGLMRPLQVADDLVSPSRHAFTLTAADAARLEDRR